MNSTLQLAEAVRHALRAPSVHNTQPWRWRIDDGDDDDTGGRVELYADLNRHLYATDPQRRDLVISCGAALHHLLVALAHIGRRATVLRMPDPEDPTHLATVVIGGAPPRAPPPPPPPLPPRPPPPPPPPPAC